MGLRQFTKSKWYLVLAVAGTLLIAAVLISCTKTAVPTTTAATTAKVDLTAAAAQQWGTTLHANVDTAKAESGNTNCARCHTEQGFMAWIKQSNMTLPLQGAAGTATAVELSAIVNNTNARPTTCTVCHVANNAVRISGDTAMLASGYKATDVGKGAICITCHNTRNGAKSDATPITAYQAPHVAAQGDVLMGQNAYFVVTPIRSPHASLENTCVTCHMELTPAPGEFAKAGGTNHTFKASTEICGDCHSKEFNGETFMSGYEAKIKVLGTKMGTYLLSKITAPITLKDYTPHKFGGKDYDVKSNGLVITKDNIVSVEPTEPHGQQGYLFTFKTPVTFEYAPAGDTLHKMTVTTASVQLGDITTDGTKALIPLTDPLVKAGWNYFLSHGDASEGVHNPSFVSQILDGAVNALK